MPKLLQVCNVGRITGGTAACAWTIARSLPEWQHTVAFLSAVGNETRAAFGGCEVLTWDRVRAAAVAEIGPDVVLFHNTSRSRVDAPLPAFTVQYLHSRIAPATADLVLYCSSWLAHQYDGDVSDVCHQPVPRPVAAGGPPAARPLRDELIIGRLCTPVARKWPADLICFYRVLAAKFPAVRWEFVGCPEALHAALSDACCGRAEFVPASWTARSRLCHWDALVYHHPHLTESFGRVCAEAMRAGCIPIVDARGGFPEQVADGCGFLCRDADEFAAAIEQVCAPGRRLALSRAARAHADEQFSLVRFAAEFAARLNAVP